MKIQTINQLISVFKDIATRHYQINGFGIGDSWEIGADKAYMHPVLWINPTTANMPSTDTGYKTFEIDFDVRVFDLVHKDESNENEVLSDTIDILKDIITEFKSHPYYVNSQLNITGDISFEAFTEEFDEEVSGWLCEISLMTPILTSFCGIPAADITGFEFPGVDCPDVNVLCPVFIDEIIGVEPIVVTSDGTTRTISLNGSSIIGADNGLNVLGGVVELGGTLNKDTTIDGNDKQFILGSPTSRLSNYYINGVVKTEIYSFTGFGSVTTQYTPNSMTTVASDSTTTLNTNKIFTPTQERTDITDANLNKNSYLDIKSDQVQSYTEDTTTGQYGTFDISPNTSNFTHNTGGGISNGLYLSDGQATLTMEDSTTGLYSGQYITAGGSKQLTSNGVGWKSEVETTVNYFKASYIDPTFTSTMLLSVDYNLQTNDFNVNSNNFDISPIGGLLKFNSPTTKGVEYDADYSVNFTNRSLVDKGYVDTAINSAPDKFVSSGAYDTINNKIVLTLNDATTVDIDTSAIGGGGDSIYTADDTIGAGRVATLTDTLNFSEGTFNLFGLDKDKKVSYVGGDSLFGGPPTYVVNALNFKYDSNTGTGQLWAINSSEGNGKINIKGSETLIENIYTKHNLRVSGNSNAVNAERSIEMPFGTDGTWKGVNMLSTQKSGGGADFEIQTSPSGLGGTYETAIKIEKNKNISLLSSTTIQGIGTAGSSALSIYDNDTTPNKLWDFLDNGNVNVGSDSVLNITDRLALGFLSFDQSIFSSYSLIGATLTNSGTSYNIAIQKSLGQMSLNVPSGQSMNFNVGNSNKGLLTGSGKWEFKTDTLLNAKVSMPNLPTSATGLATGDLWNDGGTLKIA